jgi:hypothetical protein
MINEVIEGEIRRIAAKYDKLLGDDLRELSEKHSAFESLQLMLALNVNLVAYTLFYILKTTQVSQLQLLSNSFEQIEQLVNDKLKVGEK